MFTRPLSRAAAVSSRSFHGGATRTFAPALLSGASGTQSSATAAVVAPFHQGYAAGGLGCTATGAVTLPQAWSGGQRHFAGSKKRSFKKEKDDKTKPTKEEMEDLEEDMRAREEPAENPGEWEFDKPSQFVEYTPPPGMPRTPILDAYEKSRDPAEMERIIQESFDVLPERAGPRRNNRKRREHQRQRTVRNIKYKAKAQRLAAYERKLQKRRDKKKREAALFATWRTPEAPSPADATETT